MTCWMHPKRTASLRLFTAAGPSWLQVTLTDYEHKVLLNLRECVVRNMAPDHPALGTASDRSKPAQTIASAPCNASQTGSEQRLVSANGGSGGSSHANGKLPSLWEMVSTILCMNSPIYTESQPACKVIQMLQALCKLQQAFAVFWISMATVLPSNGVASVSRRTLGMHAQTRGHISPLCRGTCQYASSTGRRRLAQGKLRG